METVTMETVTMETVTMESVTMETVTMESVTMETITIFTFLTCLQKINKQKKGLRQTGLGNSQKDSYNLSKLHPTA